MAVNQTAGTLVFIELECTSLDVASAAVNQPGTWVDGLDGMTGMLMLRIRETDTAAVIVLAAATPIPTATPTPSPTPR